MKWFLEITNLPDYPHRSIMGPFEDSTMAQSNRQSYLEVHPEATISEPFESKQEEVNYPPVVTTLYSCGDENRKLWSDGHTEVVS